MRLLITGGAGFVGSSLAFAFKRTNPAWNVVAIDNLRRRGSELNLSEFKAGGIEFVHGDVRQMGDLEDLTGNFDLLIEASAEPSVLAGINGSANYVLQTNLVGTLNCLEFARRRAPNLIFLSTSRVYSILPLRSLELIETETRFELSMDQSIAGVSSQGIAENFPVHLPRSLYGATKLASEMIIQEYVACYGLRAVINRCGVICGPGQFGKADQGIFTLWVANHYFKKPLQYVGFGGTGKQVRDLLHPADLYELLVQQLGLLESSSGQVFNVGGGKDISTSLSELTAICREVTGNCVPIGETPETSAVDIPIYISDYHSASESFNWRPQRSVRQIATEITGWIKNNEKQLTAVFE